MNHCKELEQLLWKQKTSLESGLDIVNKDTLSIKPTLVLLRLVPQCQNLWLVTYRLQMSSSSQSIKGYRYEYMCLSIN